jgi:hypothetical protein
MDITRKDFLRTSMALVGAGLGLSLVGTSSCGDDGDSPPRFDSGTADQGSKTDGSVDQGSDTGTIMDTGTSVDQGSDTGMSVDHGVMDGSASSTCLTIGTTTEIGTNHGHNLVVSKADVAAGVEKTYSIQGASGHDHEVTLTAADFSQLQAGNMVTKQSSEGDLHTHEVTVSCA